MLFFFFKKKKVQFHLWLDFPSPNTFYSFKNNVQNKTFWWVSSKIFLLVCSSSMISSKNNTNCVNSPNWLLRFCRIQNKWDRKTRCCIKDTSLRVYTILSPFSKPQKNSRLLKIGTESQPIHYLFMCHLSHPRTLVVFFWSLQWQARRR